MEFNFYIDKQLSHPKLTNIVGNRFYAVLVSLRDATQGEEIEWSWDWWNWEDCVHLAYDNVDFWYENGLYYHILQKPNKHPFTSEDFRIISEELCSSSSDISILEVNIYFFL